MVPATTEVFANNNGGQFLQKISGASFWLPMYANLQEKDVSNIFETESAMFIGSNKGLPASLSIASIVEVGEYFFCGHPTGIFRSSDKGKTWKLLFPSIGSKVFNLSVSGNVIYAVPKDGGC